MKKLLLTTALTSLGAANIAHAQAPQTKADTVSGYVGVGVLAIPEYEGADDMQAVPMLAGRVNYNQYYVETKGLGLRANVSPYPNVEFGPTVNFRFGRDDDVDNDAIASLSEVDDAFEAGGFVKVPFRGVFNQMDELSLNAEILTDVSDAHEGTLITFGPSYSYAVQPRLRMTTSLSATYANDDYMDAYYSVSATDAGVSGLSEFEAEGGIQDIGLTLVVNYAINQKWGVIGLLGYKELLGDAKDSPIIDDEGQSGQFMSGLGVSYRF